jgi:hypothetical protein
MKTFQLWRPKKMKINRNLQRNFGKLKIVTNAIQDEVTNVLIDSLCQLQKDSGSTEAYKVAELFQKAIGLYTDGVPMSAALMTVGELNKENKNFAKILGFAVLCASTVLPYVLIDQESFDDFVDELAEDAKKESSRTKTTARVTRLKPRSKAKKKA